jgi:spore maturation protein CgeB
MRILYYSWNEIIKNDIISTMINMGFEVSLIDYTLRSTLEDNDFLNYVENKLIEAEKENKKYNVIFSCNYIPVLSNIALDKKIYYVSWTYDSPCMTMYSKTIFNTYNILFHFDSHEVKRISDLGVKNIYHLPLAVNIDRIHRIIRGNVNRNFNNDVRFMGNLYNDEPDFIEQVNNLPEYAKGYIKGMEDVQLLIQGNDIINELLDNKLMNKMRKYISFTKVEGFFVNDRQLVFDMLCKNISSRERIEILEQINKSLPLVIYTHSDVSNLKNIINKGYINYESDMPKMFSTTAVNLNITLRSIKTGIPLRALDIMGAGGFLLTNYCEELNEYMVDGKDFVTFYDANDCVEKCRFYLQHIAERERIALNGMKKIKEMFTYEMQMSKMFNTVKGII